LEAYPNLVRIGLAREYPHSVINIIVTAVGGETSVPGAERFSFGMVSGNAPMTHVPTANEGNEGNEKRLFLASSFPWFSL